MRGTDTIQVFGGWPDGDNDRDRDIFGVAERFFKAFHRLDDHEQQAILRETHSCWEFEKLCKNRKAAYTEKYRSGSLCKRPRGLRHSYTVNELMVFLGAYTNPYHRAAALWQLYTGSRVGEVNTIKQMGENLLMIKTSKTANRGRGHKIVPLHGVLKELIWALPWIQNRSTAYLRKIHNDVLHSLPEGFNPVYGLAGATEFHPEGRQLYQHGTHSLRYTATDWCGEAGVDPFYIAMFRGDEAVSVLGIQAHYRQFKPERLRIYLEDVFSELNTLVRERGFLSIPES